MAGRIAFRHGSLLEPLAGDPPFDLIVANLPYVGLDEAPTLQRDVRDFAGRMAGGTGLALAVYGPAEAAPRLSELRERLAA